MKRIVLGTLLGVVLVTTAIAMAEQREVGSQHAAPAMTGPVAVAASELIVVPTTLGEKQVLTVVDPRQRVLTVYHIDLSTGKITLKSVRNIQWDLQITDFNGADPSPRQIQSQFEQR